MTMSDRDVREALERLSRAADTDPSEVVGSELLSGIRTEVRRNRNRAAVLASASVAAAAVIGYAVFSTAPGPQSASEPDVAGPSSATPTSPPAPTPTESATEPDAGLVPIETAPRRDVDGDGSPDSVRILVPGGAPKDEPVENAWLDVRTSTGTDAVFQLVEMPSYVSLYGPRVQDLDGNGGSEIFVLRSGGGESGDLSVWTWSNGLVRAEPAADTPGFLVNETGLSLGSEELGVAFQDGRMISWRVVGPGSHEVEVWQWQLEGTTLTATKQAGTQCVSFGVVSPC
jgi:hypothetical protein